MPNVYLYAVAALVFVVSLAGAGLKGYSLGANNVRAEYAARDAKAAADYAAKERELTDAARKKEAEWASAFQKAGKNFQRELDKNATTHLAILADIDAKRLRDPYADSKACGNQASTTPANPVATSPTGTEFSAKADRFFKREAQRADGVAIALNFCIDLLEQERQSSSTVGGGN